MNKDEMKNEEWYVIFNMNCKYEICRMCPKSGLFKGSYEECEKWIKQKKKEEKKDEMKNRISMALKDPTLQQGFEVICKNLVELEKENKTVSRKANEAIADKLLITAKYNEVLNDLNQENGKLQNENAELKEELQKWKDEWQEQVQKANDEGYARTLQTMQLTKATKIIKELCGMVRELNKPNVQLTNVDYSLAEAEQFIKDSEGK